MFARRQTGNARDSNRCELRDSARAILARRGDPSGYRDWPPGWTLFHAESFASLSYLLSGGFSKPALYPARWLSWLQRCDEMLSRWPRLFGARCLIGLRPD